jgi:pimeloyl-ACP methyl ester carboxylesterase
MKLDCTMPTCSGGWLQTAILLLGALGSSCSGRTSARADAPTRVVVNGVELHYIEAGQGDPVILLHGDESDYRAWAPQMLVLKPRHRVISYSRRYHFPNDNPISGTSHSALVDAEDLAALMAQLGLPSAHLVGTSYGAFTALAFAVKHPEMVRSLVLAEPPVNQWVTGEARGASLYQQFLSTVYEPAGQAFSKGDMEAAMRMLIDSSDGPGAFNKLPPENRTAILANARFLQALTSSSDPYPNLSRSDVSRLAMPILIVKGAETDELHKVVTEEVGRVLPQAQRVTIAWAGHASPRQNPESFNYAMLEFLAAAGKSDKSRPVSGGGIGAR